MAVIKKNKSVLRGNIGDLLYREVNGVQIISAKPASRKNPKTEKQMAHRVKWTNISAMYRAADGALYNAFEGKSGNINDYTLFMGTNLYLEQEVYLTKQEKENNACVVAPYQISKGKLPSILTSLEEGLLITNIRLGELDVTPETTIRELTNAILEENTSFLEDDCLSIIIYTQEWNTDFKVPTATCWKESFMLDMSDFTKLSSVLTIVMLCNKNGCLATNQLDGDFGIAIVHSRKRSNKSVAISSQLLTVQNKYLEHYSSKEQQRKAMISYGVKEDSFLSQETGVKKMRKNQGF